MSTPIRTATKDINYFSINSNSVVYNAGTDQEDDKGDIPIPLVLNLIPTNPKDYDSILKISGRHNLIVPSVLAAQGKENSVDINNEAAFIVLGGQWGGVGDEGEQVFTIKGGSHSIIISGEVISRGTDTDIEIGCWSDQSTKPVSDIDLSGLYRSNGAPLRVVFGRVNQPWRVLLGKAPKDIKLPKNAKIDYFGSLGEMTYWWLKRAFVAIRH